MQNYQNLKEKLESKKHFAREKKINLLIGTLFIHFLSHLIFLHYLFILLVSLHITQFVTYRYQIIDISKVDSVFVLLILLYYTTVCHLNFLLIGNHEYYAKILV